MIMKVVKGERMKRKTLCYTHKATQDIHVDIIKFKPAQAPAKYQYSNILKIKNEKIVTRNSSLPPLHPATKHCNLKSVPESRD